MTVCISAISDDGIIFGAADRMLTAGDVEFEPPFPKIFSISNAIRIMTAGDSALHAEIIQSVQSVTGAKIKQDPETWLSVREVAELYAKSYVEIRSRRAELALLTPLGLDRVSFVNNQKFMADSFIDSLTRAIVGFEMPPCAAIITGLDTVGPFSHIYVVNDGEQRCFDMVGFASIGAGSRHAESLFQIARYSPRTEAMKAFWLTFFAKKRAEVAPGVGADTDMFTIGPRLGQSDDAPQGMIVDLKGLYDKYIERENDALHQVEEDMKRYVEALGKSAAKTQQKSDDTSHANGD